MNEYIKREDAEQAILDCPISGMLDLINLQTAISNIDAIPSADVVENIMLSPITTATKNKPIEFVGVVRCKDCKYMTEHYDVDGNAPYWTCSEWDSGTDYDGYCSYGERKDE